MDGQRDTAAPDGTTLTAPAEAHLTGESSIGDTEPAGEEYLLFWLGESPYLAPLAELREALPGVPRHVALPFSPRWLWGIFPLRTDLVILVDPLPTLLYGPDTARQMDEVSASRPIPALTLAPEEAPQALVIGEGEHILALLADRIGEIHALHAEERRPVDSPAERGSAAPLPQYVAGAYAIAGLEREALALRLASLAEDILSALEERPIHE